MVQTNHLWRDHILINSEVAGLNKDTSASGHIVSDKICLQATIWLDQGHFGS